MTIGFKKLDQQAKAPIKVHAADAGFDLFALSFDWNHRTRSWDYRTGIAIEIPDGYFGAIFPRSSIRRYGMMLANSVAVIDANYRGEIVCSFRPLEGSANPPLPIYAVGDRIGQLVILPLPQAELVEVAELSPTERGVGGFGSTGQ